MISQDKTAIRDAATVIAIRDRHSAPRILMGQRGAKAAFMPSKFVFPGGAVDAGDGAVAAARPLPRLCRQRLVEDADVDLSHALGIAAVREMWEETGMILGQKGTWNTPPTDDWRDFAATGHIPDMGALQFVFRAITPPGRPRRFDARFFLVDASDIASDLDDFSAASDELSHLQWIALDDVRSLDMPFITEVVLSEIAARVKDTAPPKSVPFFKNRDEQSLFRRLYGEDGAAPAQHD